MKFGYIKDEWDDRDYLVRTKKMVELPEKIDLSMYLPEVRNQGEQGSCVGHGIGGILTATAIQLQTYKEWFSPRWIYYGGRFIGGYVNQDIGTEPRLALEWCLSSGCLYESSWKYNPIFTTEHPVREMFEEAKKVPILSYIRVVDGVDGICTALSNNYLVAIGTPWYKKWFSTDDNGKLKKPYCFNEIAGGHETYLYGYDNNTECFSGVNSWGKEWGNDGKFLMPYSAINQFKRHGGYDAHIINVEWR